MSSLMSIVDNDTKKLFLTLMPYFALMTFGTVQDKPLIV